MIGHILLSRGICTNSSNNSNVENRDEFARSCVVTRLGECLDELPKASINCLAISPSISDSRSTAMRITIKTRLHRNRRGLQLSLGDVDELFTLILFSGAFILVSRPQVGSEGFEGMLRWTQTRFFHVCDCESMVQPQQRLFQDM